jgi:peptidoglycan/xylan/chitin deacetylase (PgdA/CDA1 family)
MLKKRKKNTGRHRISKPTAIGTIAAVLLALTVLLCKKQEENAYPALTFTDYSALTAPERVVAMPEEGEKVCYLTFDDGPSKNTEKILDILAEYEAKATFFVIGNGLDDSSGPLLQRMIAEGHYIGMHANDHAYASLYADMDSFLTDYETLYLRLKEEYGIETALFRFPGGSCCSYLGSQRTDYLNQMHKRGFACFDWNVSGEDSVGSPTVASIQRNVFSGAFKYNTPVVLLHDSSVAAKTVEALPGILEEIKEAGYRFETLEHRREYVFSGKR